MLLPSHICSCHWLLWHSLPAPEPARVCLPAPEPARVCPNTAVLKVIKKKQSKCLDIADLTVSVYFSVLIPQRLSAKWVHINQRFEEGYVSCGFSFNIVHLCNLGQLFSLIFASTVEPLNPLTTSFFKMKCCLRLAGQSWGAVCKSGCRPGLPSLISLCFLWM